MKIYKIAQSIANSSFPDEYIPNRNTPYLQEYNLINQNGNSNKRYIIRVYAYPNGQFTVCAHRGRIGQRTQLEQKGRYAFLSNATNIAGRLARNKISKGYTLVNTPSNLEAEGVGGNRISERDLPDFQNQTSNSINRPIAPSTPNANPQQPHTSITITTKENAERATLEERNNALYDNHTPLDVKTYILGTHLLSPELLLQFVLSDYASRKMDLIMVAIESPLFPPEGITTYIKQKYLKMPYSKIMREILSSNKATPEALSYVLEKQQGSLPAASNPKTPPEALAKVLEKKEHSDDVMNAVSLNPSTPPMAVAKWISETGKGTILRALDSLKEVIKQDSTTPTLKEVIYVIYTLWHNDNFINQETIRDVESIIDTAFDNPEVAEYASKLIPKPFFDEIGMRPEKRQIVENTHTNVIEDDMLEDIFGKKKSWYKQAKLLDKNPNDENLDIYLSCMYCKRWAVDNNGRPLWRKNLTPDEQNEANEAIRLMETGELKTGKGISHGICPYCSYWMKQLDKKWPQDEKDEKFIIENSLASSSS